MTRYAVAWSDAALSDLDKIQKQLRGELAERDVKRLLQDIVGAVHFLPDFPKMYALFPESDNQARHIPVYSWRLLYTVDDNAKKCLVTNVVHTAKSWPPMSE